MTARAPRPVVAALAAVLAIGSQAACSTAAAVITPGTRPPAATQARVTQAQATAQVTTSQPVTLTATLDVPSGAAVRDQRFVWAGPADAPVIRITGGGFATVAHVVVEVPDGRHATAAVELVNGPDGGPLGTHLSDIRVGTPGRPANVDYGVHWTGTLNGDSNTLTNIAVFGAARAGVAVANPQATGNSFRGLYVFNSPVGLQSSAGGTIICDNCGFIGSTDVDIELDAGAGLILTGTYSEGSRSFARVEAGPGGGGLSVTGGYWQHGPAAAGPTITGLKTCCGRTWLRLTDFMVTPLGSTPLGTIDGFSPAQRFLSDVAGIG